MVEYDYYASTITFLARWLYCQQLGVSSPFLEHCGPPSATDMSGRDLNSLDVRVCLPPFVRAVIKLYDAYYAALQNPALPDAVLDLLEALKGFLHKLQTPLAHPGVTSQPFEGAAEHARLAGIVLYLVRHDKKEMVNHGFHQLMELKTLLINCRIKLSV